MGIDFSFTVQSNKKPEKQGVTFAEMKAEPGLYQLTDDAEDDSDFCFFLSTCSNIVLSFDEYGEVGVCNAKEFSGERFIKTDKTVTVELKNDQD